jgi:23S rRNA pseudouridine1911/1915/1917 synthase
MSAEISIEEVVEFTADTPGYRLDRFLAERLPDRSRSEIQRWIKNGMVLVGGATSKPGYRLEAGDLITVSIPSPEPYEVLPEPIPLDIRYEDDDLLVVNKPAGMVTHPAAGHSTGTLVNAVLHHVPDLVGVGGVERPGIVHRLDKDTTGLIVVAKNDRAHRYLQEQFKERTVEKKYQALLFGFLSPARGRIEAPIGRDPKDRKKMAVVPVGSGREAVTRYRVLRYYRDDRTVGRQQYTLVEAMPKTGRTHQIRVHMAYIGHPIVGDKVYGRRKQRLPIERHFLHAGYLRFRRPSDGKWVEVSAELPDDLQFVLEILTPED